ncbi:hypothetical protein G6F57_010373 [Rhizopus arrhizus]|nr:hypothetical protein G6F57_010373 [Rhizopus arrhizus]
MVPQQQSHGGVQQMQNRPGAPLQTTDILILICSNTGDGDAPDNSLKFWRFLRRNKDKTYFKHAKFTVLGLGDSNYSNFNNTGKRLEKKLKDLGATVFYEKGLADDAEGLEETVDPWIEKLWEVLPTVLVQKSELSVKDSIEAEKQIEKEMTELQIDPYSMKNRKESLPEPVEKYAQLDHSLVVPQTEPPKRGFPLQISLEGLAPGAKLTGLPRVAVPVVKLIRLDEKRKREDRKEVPEFVATPAPISYAPVTMVSCLSSADAVKRTLEVELDVGEGVDYEPGDAFGVVAPNDEDLVQAILNRLSISLEEANDDLYKVEGDNLPSHLQHASSATLLELFRYAVDLTSQPRKAFFRMLADHTSDPKEKLSLMYICSKQGTAVFNAIRDECPTVLDILETFPSCQPPIERILDLLPAHMPRFYSISSSPLKRNGKIRFAFNVVEYITRGNVERKGVATPWMDRVTERVPSRTTPTNVEITLDKTIQIPIFLRQNTNAFTLPAETERPLILIGPGTGIAPFIGFLEHRQMQRKIRLSMGGVGSHPERQIRDAFGPVHVYYGFRNRSMDFLFEKEIGEFEADGTITHLALAESRASDGSPKVYVQDLIKRDSAQLFDLIINQDAAIYVCGDAKGMAKDVQDALVEILVNHQQMDVVEANKTLFSWIASKKYLRDLWA